MRRISSQYLPASRKGISLLELLIALGLGILLISSVGATLMIILRSESAGRERMERSQLVRALYLRMSNDLRAATYLEEFATETDSEEMSASEETTQDDLETELGIEDVAEYLSPAEAILSKTSGLYGDESSLVVYLHRPERLPPQIAAQNSSPDEEDAFLLTDSGLRAVSWFLNGASSMGSLVEPATGSFGQDLGLRESSQSGGLSRLERDAMEVTFSDDAADLLSFGAELLAPEVATITFRYFDGADWVSQWDSTVQGRLPSAVEVTLTFEELQTQTNRVLFGDDSALQDSSSYRFVIALLMAPPPLTEIEL